jgi:hypothetical protein
MNAEKQAGDCTGSDQSLLLDLGKISTAVHGREDLGQMQPYTSGLLTHYRPAGGRGLHVQGALSDGSLADGLQAIATRAPLTWTRPTYCAGQ